MVQTSYSFVGTCAKSCTTAICIRSHVQHEEMTQCLTQELGTLIRLSGIKEVTSVYFGGGTWQMCVKPSLALARIDIETSSETTTTFVSEHGLLRQCLARTLI